MPRPGATGVTRVLSIVAGVPCARLEAALGGEPAVVRAMPNTPALVGAGVTAISGGSFATSQDLAWAEDVLSAVGHRRPPARAPARCGDRALGIGPGLLLPRRRGAHGGGRADGPHPRGEPDPGGRDDARLGRPAARRRAATPRPCAPW